MIRYYIVSGDLKNGQGFEYVFRYHKRAENKYNSIHGVPYKSIVAVDDKEGTIFLKREAAPD